MASQLKMHFSKGNMEEGFTVKKRFTKSIWIRYSGLHSTSILYKTWQNFPFECNYFFTAVILCCPIGEMCPPESSLERHLNAE